MSGVPPNLPRVAPSKQHYTTREVAELLQVAVSLVRFWTKQFSALRPQKDRHGIVKYSSNDVATLRRIYHLVKEQGYTLQGAQAVLKSPSSPSSHHTAIIRTLKEVRTFLTTLREKAYQK